MLECIRIPTLHLCCFRFTLMILQKAALQMAIWKSQHRHLGINIGTDVGFGTAKILFCLVKSLFLSFEISYEKSIHGEVLFKYTWINEVNQMAPVQTFFLQTPNYFKALKGNIFRGVCIY